MFPRTIIIMVYLWVEIFAIKGHYVYDAYLVECAKSMKVSVPVTSVLFMAICS